VTVVGEGMTDADLHELGRFPVLETMISFERLTPARLGKLSLCPNVQRLEFEDRQDLTTKQWQALKTQTQIERLDLTGGGETRRITNAALRHVAAMRQLRELDLRGTSVGDAGVKQLASLTNLEVLDLERTDVGDAGVEFLPSLSKLRRLSLQGTHVTDATLRRLLSLKRLTSLDVGRTRINDPLPVVLKMKGLRSLGLSRIEAINDDSLPQLAQLPALRELDLRLTRVTRFRLALFVTQTKWKKVLMRTGLLEERECWEIDAFEKFCREHDVFVEVEME